MCTLVALSLSLPVLVSMSVTCFGHHLRTEEIGLGSFTGLERHAYCEFIRESNYGDDCVIVQFQSYSRNKILHSLAFILFFLRLIFGLDCLDSLHEIVHLRQRRVHYLLLLQLLIDSLPLRQKKTAYRFTQLHSDGHFGK